MEVQGIDLETDRGRALVTFLLLDDSVKHVQGIVRNLESLAVLPPLRGHDEAEERLNTLAESLRAGLREMTGLGELVFARAEALTLDAELEELTDGKQ